MIQEEADRIAGLVADGQSFDRSYPHPDFNNPQIRIRVNRQWGNGYVVNSSLLPHGGASGSHVYRSVVRPGQPLNTRVRTAFRRATERGTLLHWRNLATAEYDARPAYVFDLGVKAYAARQLHPSPSDYALRYSYNWTEPISKAIIEGYRVIEEWRTGLGEGWSEALVRRWVATLDG